MRFKWDVPDIHEKDEQSELVTMGHSCKFHTYPQTKTSKTTKEKNQSVSEIDASALVKQQKIL